MVIPGLAPGFATWLSIGNHNLIMNQLLKDLHGGCGPLSIARRSPSVGLSARSRNGKAWEVASQLKGGGHPNAAGATRPTPSSPLQLESIMCSSDYSLQP